MRNAASIARGAPAETSVPSVESISRSKLISPRPIVTGSISRRTCITRGSRKSNASSIWNPSRRSGGIAMLNWTIVPASTPNA